MAINWDWTNVTKTMKQWGLNNTTDTVNYTNTINQQSSTNWLQQTIPPWPTFDWKISTSTNNPPLGRFFIPSGNGTFFPCP